MADLRFVSYMTPGFPRSLFEAFATCLDAELAVETEVTFETELSGPAPGDDPFADRRMDVGWICSTSFVDLSLRSAEPSVRLAGVAWVPDDPDVGGRPVYFSDLVVRPDSPIRSFGDLAGRRIGCNDPVSLSGHHALRFEIEERGDDPDSFAELVFTGGHHRSIDAVLDGTIDAAVVDSVVRIGRARQSSEVAELRLVDRLGPWPVQPLVARSDLDATFVNRIAETLLGANENPVIRTHLRAAALTELVPVADDHYEGVCRAMSH